MSCENYDPCFPDQPVVDRYLPIWASQPSFWNKPAFVWAKDSPSGLTWTSLTYSDLNAAVEAMASKLLCSLNRGDVILVLCSPGLRLVKVIFACQRAGLVAVPLVPPDLSLAGSGAAHHHLLRAISQAKPKAAVADRSYVEAVRSSTSSANDELVRTAKKLQWLSVEHLEDSVSYSSSSSYSGCGPDDTYLIQYTSGATGLPKPVLVTAGAAAHNVRAARTAYDLQPSSVIVSWLPQYHDCGLMFLLLTVVSGATCVLASPAAFLHRPRLWLELVTEFRATCTPVPALALPLTVKRGSCDHGKLPLKLGSLTNLIVINEPVYKSPVDEFIEEFSAAGIEPSCISPSYGLAENCTYVSTSWPREELGGANRYPNMPSYKKLLPSARLGKPYAEEDIVIVVVDEATYEPVEDGVEGEIWVSSASNASGYLGHPSLTREVFNARIPVRHRQVIGRDRVGREAAPPPALHRARGARKQPEASSRRVHRGVRGRWRAGDGSSGAGGGAAAGWIGDGDVQEDMRGNKRRREDGGGGSISGPGGARGEGEHSQNHVREAEEMAGEAHADGRQHALRVRGEIRGYPRSV